MLKTGRAEENDYIWRGCMYSYFGEEYMEAVKDLESKKINDYIENFDQQTIKIKEMFSSFSQKDNLISSSEDEMEQ